MKVFTYESGSDVHAFLRVANRSSGMIPGVRLKKRSTSGESVVEWARAPLSVYAVGIAFSMDKKGAVGAGSATARLDGGARGTSLSIVGLIGELRRVRKGVGRVQSKLVFLCMVVALDLDAWELASPVEALISLSTWRKAQVARVMFILR
jgi:hypothetical protein